MTPRAMLPGVDELFGSAKPKEGEQVLVPLDRLVPAADNPRRDLGDVAALAASISAVGLLEPLIVTQDPAGSAYLVVAGHRRLAAAKLAGLTHLPVIVRHLSDAERAEIMLIENLQRQGLHPLEEASAYRRLLDFGYSQRRLAERVGTSQATISKRLALLNLPEPARDALDSGRITLEDAQALTKLNNLPDRLERALTQSARYGGGLRQAVDAELDAHQREVARAKAEEALTAAGLTIVAWPESGGFYGRKEAALSQPECWSFGGHRIDVAVEAHAGEPCHAATVNPRDASTIWICTDPDRHRPKGGSDVKGEDPQVAAKREEARARREAERGRADFLRRLLAGKLPTREATELALETLVAGVNHAPARLACELLELAPVVRETSWGRPEKDYRAALTDSVADQPTRLLTVALAIALAEVEDNLRNEWHGWGGQRDERHFAFLTERGYAPSEFETRRLEEGRNSAAEDLHTDDDLHEGLSDADE